ncbi:MAG TPA: hypothetical protein VGK26_01525 [Thermoanaerobaculia bacterium]|jgi:hypothetical protein
MQVDDCGRSSLADVPIPESGRFVNPNPSPNPKPKLSMSGRLHRFLERVRFVVAVTRPRSPADRSGSDEAYRSPSTR